jgi:predicted DsbA family dithiol-disulfide isomerase
MVRVIEVFADTLCPFTHVGLRRITAERDRRGRADVVLRCRAWPLESVNGAALEPAVVAEEVAALRASVTPELFAGFDPARFARSSLPALSLAAAAYRVGLGPGERVSLAVRTALFEEGRDVEDPAVLAAIAGSAGIDFDTAADDGAAVRADWQEGRERGVLGSPHFFVDGAGLFCPTLVIAHGDDGFTVELDRPAFEDFVHRCFG